jgi:DNA-binding response OmpR family regulator
MKILITDDEREIRKILRILLEDKGYEVIEATNGQKAIAEVKAHPELDLCIMDIMMPRMSGVEATQRIREFSDVPVLFLTAKSLQQDRAEAYASGGDDYLVKPFSSGELLLKVEAMIRRYNNYRTKTLPEESNVIPLGDSITVSPSTREVKKRGALVDMRDKEYEVLLYLLRNRGKSVNPAELYEAVWEEMPLPSSGNTVTVHILNLRRKLEDNPSSPKLIRTVWGKGYQID